MENKERQILSEIVAMASVLRGQLEALEAKIAEFQEVAGVEEDDMTPIDLELDDIQGIEPIETVVEEPVEEVVEEVDDDLPFGDIEDPVTEPAEEESVLESVVEEPVAAPVALVDAAPVHAVIDSMTDRQAWRTDMPGSPVRDIRSAISLNDRILFINTLFGQDPMAFQECLTRINQLETLDEAVEYVATVRPEWDFESEVVYRFMMAVRRKVK